MAPVIGLLALFVAATVSAGTNLTLKSGEKNTPRPFASESLSTSAVTTIKPVLYKIAATKGDLEITATTDILLETGSKYVRYDFGGAGLTMALTDAFLRIIPLDTTQDPPAFGTAVAADAVAYKGTEGDDMVIFRLPNPSDVGYARGSMLNLDLSSSVPVPAESDTGRDRTGDKVFDFGLLGVTKPGTVTASVGVYDSLTDARNAENAIFEAGPEIVLSFKSAVSGSIEVTVPAPQADVGSLVADENGAEQNEPFRRFTTASSGTASSAVLAMTNVKVNGELFNAMTGDQVKKDVGPPLVTGVRATATSAAGNFAVISAADGGLIPENRYPWMVSTTKACGDGAMELMVEDGQIDTYDADPDGPGAANVSRGKGDLTPDGIADANKAVTLDEHLSDHPLGEDSHGYFCVLATGNENAIPRVRGTDGANAYMLTLQPIVAGPFQPDAIGPFAAGWIDRNGTTVNLTYLSTHEAYNQRLVIVNRGSEPAEFFVDDLQLESGVTVVSNMLTGSVPAGGRLVTRVQDKLTLAGMTRAAATVNVVAPPEDIDVMTIQVHPGTGQIDTTMYEAQ